MNDIPIFYINLASRPDRREFMEQQFSALGLEAERIEAVTPKDLSAAELERSCNPRKYRWLMPVELAVNKSHLRALERIARGRAPIALILEDDVVLSSRLPDFLHLLESTTPAADILKIETDGRPIRTDRLPVAVLGDYQLKNLRGWTYGGGGYLVTQAAAQHIISSGQLLVDQVDRVLFDPLELLPHQLRLRHLSPALCIQLRSQEEIADFSGSDIYPETSQRQKVEAGVRASRLHHSLRRLLHEKLVVDTNHIYHQWVRGAKKASIAFAK